MSAHLSQESTTLADILSMENTSAASGFHRWVDRNVYRKSTGRAHALPYRRDFRSDSFYAEDYHQQYLAKNPDGYCGLKGTGISCPVRGSGRVAVG